MTTPAAAPPSPSSPSPEPSPLLLRPRGKSLAFPCPPPLLSVPRLRALPSMNAGGSLDRSPPRTALQFQFRQSRKNPRRDTSKGARPRSNHHRDSSPVAVSRPRGHRVAGSISPVGSLPTPFFCVIYARPPVPTGHRPWSPPWLPPTATQAPAWPGPTGQCLRSPMRSVENPRSLFLHSFLAHKSLKIAE